MDADDVALLRRYAEARDERAFGELVARHVDLVHSAAVRSLAGDSHAAADVTQRVFVALARQAGGLARDVILPAWLYTTTRHLAVDHIRSEQRRRRREQTAHTLHQVNAPDRPNTDWEKLRTLLDPAMDTLGERDREAVVLRFFARRPFADIGRALGVSEDAARMRVDRALEKLRERLARDGVRSTAAALGVTLGQQAVAAAPAGLGASVTDAALAWAPTAAASSVTIGFTMHTPTLIASLLALSAAGIAFHQHAGRREAEARHAASDKDLSAMRAELARTQERAAAGEQRVAALQQELKTAQASAAPTRAAASPAPASRGTLFLSSGGNTDPFSRATSLPEAMSASYAAFFRQLGFTPAQREQFVGVMVEWKERGNALFGEAIRAGTKPDQDLHNRIRAQTDSDRDAKIRATFGEGVFQAFQQYETNRPFRSVTEQLATQLFNTGTPLMPNQADQLVAIMARHGEPRSLQTLKNESVLAEAQGVLSSDQLQVFKRVMEQAQSQQELARRNAGK